MLDELLADEYEAHLDELEDELPAFEHELERQEKRNRREPLEMIYDITAPHDLRIVLSKPSITTEEIDAFIADVDADPAVKLRLLEDVEPQGYGPQGDA